ncbi:type III secretion protein, partial [Pseudomonas syringae]
RRQRGAASLRGGPGGRARAIAGGGARRVAAGREAQPIGRRAWRRLRLDIARHRPQRGDDRQVAVVRPVARLLTGSDDHE